MTRAIAALLFGLLAVVALVPAAWAQGHAGRGEVSSTGSDASHDDAWAVALLERVQHDQRRERLERWGLVRLGVGVGVARSVVRYENLDDSPTGNDPVRDRGAGCCAASITAAFGRGPIGVHASLHGYLLPATTGTGLAATIDEGRPAVLGFGVGTTVWLIRDRVWFSPSVQIPWLATVVAVAAITGDRDDDESWTAYEDESSDVSIGDLGAQVGLDLTLGVDLPVTDHLAIGAAAGVGGFHLGLPNDAIARNRSGLGAHALMTLTFR